MERRVQFDEFINKILNLSFRAILVLLVIAIIFGIGKSAWGLKELFSFSSANLSYKDIILNIFTILILIGISKTFLEFLVLQRVKITSLIDTTLVFVLREVMILLYAGEKGKSLLIPITLLLLVLGLLRGVFIYLTQRELAKKQKAGFSALEK